MYCQRILRTVYYIVFVMLTRSIDRTTTPTGGELVTVDTCA